MGGAPSATDEDLEGALEVATAHIVAPARSSSGYATPPPWPADLHDGVLLAAVLTYRNMESPTPAAASEGGAPVVPPIAWDRWTRHDSGPTATRGLVGAVSVPTISTDDRPSTAMRSRSPSAGHADFTIAPNLDAIKALPALVVEPAIALARRLERLRGPGA